MLLFTEDQTKIRADKVRQPLMSGHRGRTWDFTRHFVNGIETKFWIDTTWGEAFYFEYQDQWYRMSFHRGNSMSYKYDSENVELLWDNGLNIKENVKLTVRVTK